MLMTLGDFVFSLSTAPLDQLQRDARWKHGQGRRVGQRDALQYLGPGEESITLNGVLLPELTGGPHHLDQLRAMADEGKAWVLIDGTGKAWGQFIIDSLSDTRRHFYPNGAARKIDFRLKLKRYDTRRTDELGELGRAKP